MERIYPLTDEHLQHIIGMPVCAVLKDGLRYVGIAESCRSGRLILADPSYGRSYSYQREGQSGLPSPGDIKEHNNGLSEQKSKSQRTASNKNNKSVRGKKQNQQSLAGVASKEALSTNYAPDGYNPAGSPLSIARSNGSGLHLDDIFLLFLIV